MAEVHQWTDIEKHFSHGSLLLGNGSSIAISRKFSYPSLFEKAKELGYLTPPVEEVFNKFKVDDFELVLRRLWQAILVNDALNIERGAVDDAYEEVRESLILTVRDIHVSYEEAEPHLEHIYTFMKQFKSVFSLNYDLIVYWAAQFGNNEMDCRWFKDCFTPDYFADDWDMYAQPYYPAESATLYFYPHGNLVLHREGFSSAKKIQAYGGNDLLNTILNKWESNNLVPIFVCEGIKIHKEESISSCNYLERVFYEVLPTIKESLVVYGWGFGEQDDHILKQIKKSQAIKIAVSVYGHDQTFIGFVEEKLKKIGLTDIYFFDSRSSGCWNNPTVEFIEQQQNSEAALDNALAKILKIE